LPQDRDFLSIAQDLLFERDRDLERFGRLLHPVFPHGIEQRARCDDGANDDEAGQIAGQR